VKLGINAFKENIVSHKLKVQLLFPLKKKEKKKRKKKKKKRRKKERKEKSAPFGNTHLFYSILHTHPKQRNLRRLMVNSLA